MLAQYDNQSMNQAGADILKFVYESARDTINNIGMFTVRKLETNGVMGKHTREEVLFYGSRFDNEWKNKAKFLLSSSSTNPLYIMIEKVLTNLIKKAGDKEAYRIIEIVYKLGVGYIGKTYVLGKTINPLVELVLSITTLKLLTHKISKSISKILANAYITYDALKEKAYDSITNLKILDLRIYHLFMVMNIDMFYFLIENYLAPLIKLANDPIERYEFLKRHGLY
jgi:hypothetical protein